MFQSQTQSLQSLRWALDSRKALYHACCAACELSDEHSDARSHIRVFQLQNDGERRARMEEATDPGHNRRGYIQPGPVIVVGTEIDQASEGIPVQILGKKH